MLVNYFVSAIKVWANLGRFEPIWVDLGRFGPIWTDLGRFEPIWADLGRFGHSDPQPFVKQPQHSPWPDDPLHGD